MSQEIKSQSIAEALNNAQTIEECMSHSEYFIKVAFSFMKKAEKIQMEQNAQNESGKTESDS